MSEPATIVTCAACGAKNRLKSVDTEQRKDPVCGRCRAPLDAPAVPVTVTDANFAEVAGASKVPVLLDLWAAWCGPCRLIAPIVEQLAKELSGRVVVGKLDVDKNPAVATRFGVRSIPTLLILKNGKEVDRIVGLQSKEAILGRLEKFL